jgi:hypothetical protein
MKQRLVIRLAVALGLCLIMGPYEKALASGNAGWLLGAVGEIKGEQEIVFFVEHGGSAGIQGNQKWQVEVGKELGNAMVNFKDTLNIQKSGEQLDNTLTVVIASPITRQINGKYAISKATRLSKNTDAGYDGIEHVLDVQYDCSNMKAVVTLKNLNRMFPAASSSGYQMNVFQSALTGSFGIWKHGITLKIETEQYLQNPFRDYTLIDILYKVRRSFFQYTMDVTLQQENKEYVKDRYDGYQKKLVGIALSGKFKAKDSLKVEMQYLDRVVSGKPDKRYVKTTISAARNIPLSGDIFTVLELDNVFMHYPHALATQNSSDYTQRRAKVTLDGLTLFSTDITVYCKFDSRDYVSPSKIDIQNWNLGLEIECQLIANSKTAISFEKQDILLQGETNFEFQIKHIQQVDKGLEYELTYSKNDRIKDFNIKIYAKHNI